MKVVTIDSEILAPKVAKIMDLELVRPFYKQFPDGESYLHFDRRFNGEDIILIQTTFPNQDKKLHEIYFISKLLKELGAKKISAVIPYLAYLRQDRNFSKSGFEAITSYYVIRNLEKSGIDELYVADPHSTRILSQSKIYRGSVYPTNLFAEYYKALGIMPSLVVAADDNAEEKASFIAKPLGVDYISLEKARDRKTGSLEFKPVEFDNLESVIITDDMITSGKTIVGAIQTLKKVGAKRFYVNCTHALMLGDSEQMIMKEGVESLISTDSIENKFSQVSLSPLIAELLQ